MRISTGEDQLVLLPDLNEDGTVFGYRRFAFFYCPSCLPERGTKGELGGELLFYDIMHYCDDCGGALFTWIRRRPWDKIQRIA